MGYLDEIAALNGGGFQPISAQLQSKGLAGLGPVADYPDDSFVNSQQKPKKGFSIVNAVTNFVKGGVVNTIKGMFSLQGLAMMAGTAGLVAVAGTGVLPFLAALGLGMGAIQGVNGAMNALGKYAEGDNAGAEKEFENIGQGFVTGLLSFLGAKSGYKSGSVKTVANGGKSSYKTAGTSIKSTLSQLWKDITLRSKVEGTNMNLLQHSMDKSGKSLSSIWSRITGGSAAEAGTSGAVRPSGKQGSKGISKKKAAKNKADAEIKNAEALGKAKSRFESLRDKRKMGELLNGEKIKANIDQKVQKIVAERQAKGETLTTKDIQKIRTSLVEKWIRKNLEGSNGKKFFKKVVNETELLDMVKKNKRFKEELKAAAEKKGVSVNEYQTDPKYAKKYNELVESHMKRIRNREFNKIIEHLDEADLATGKAKRAQGHLDEAQKVKDRQQAQKDYREVEKELKDLKKQRRNDTTKGSDKRAKLDEQIAKKEDKLKELNKARMTEQEWTEYQIERRKAKVEELQEELLDGAKGKERNRLYKEIEKQEKKISRLEKHGSGEKAEQLATLEEKIAKHERNAEDMTLTKAERELAADKAAKRRKDWEETYLKDLPEHERAQFEFGKQNKRIAELKAQLEGAKSYEKYEIQAKLDKAIQKRDQQAKLVQQYFGKDYKSMAADVRAYLAKDRIKVLEQAIAEAEKRTVNGRYDFYLESLKSELAELRGFSGIFGRAGASSRFHNGELATILSMANLEGATSNHNEYPEYYL